MNRFYIFSSNTDSEVYASKIINSEDHFAICSACGSAYLKAKLYEIDLLIEGKGELPDAIVCGHWPILLVSDKVYTVWANNNISGITHYPVRLYRKDGASLRQIEARYHNIVITGRCELDLKKMGVEVINRCSECGTVKYNKEIWEFGSATLKKNSWDGSDFFTARQFEYTALCTTKNLELIYRHKLTNFSITKFEDMFDFFADDVSITEELLIDKT